MITNPKKTSHRYLRKLLVLPVAAVVVTLFAFKYKSRNENPPPVRSDQAITIVVDAAHGGIDPGVRSVDKKYTEAQLALELAKTVQRLAKEYNINVVMTRDGDNLPGNAATSQEGLLKRIEISEKTKPFAFISLHLNALPAVKTPNGAVPNKHNETGFASNAGGIEAYVSGKITDKRSNLLAATILQNISSVFPANQKPMQRHDAGIYVLDKNKYPAVVLQCGYITNEKDLEFITKPENQEKLARSILTGIVNYSNQVKENPIITDTLPNANKYTKALVVINDVVQKGITVNELDRKLKPGDIISVNVLTATSATDKYGDKGKDGVIEILTNQVKENPVITDTLPNVNKYNKALIVIDNVVQKGTVTDLNEKLQPEDIESLTVLTGASATDKYGDKGKDGAIEIITKVEYRKKKEEKIEYEIVEKKVDEEVVVKEQTIFEKTEIEAAYPGGANAWKLYLEKNLHGSVAAENNAPAGTYTVFVQFIVRKDGYIDNVKALTNHGFGMETEAIRVVKASLKWLPAIQNGKQVNAYRKQPINFVVGKQKTTTGLTPEKVRNIEQTKTTLTEAFSLFGEPTMKSLENTTITWTYEGNGSRLTIMFSRNDEKVAFYRYTGQTNSQRSEIDYNKAKTIQQDQTTFTDLEKLFGKPNQIEINNDNESWLYEGANSRLNAMSMNKKKGVVNFFKYMNQ